MVTASETQEDPSQDTHHSTRNLSVFESSIDRTADLVEDFITNARQRPQDRRERVAWPKMEETAVWCSFDIDVCTILETTLQGNAERKIDTLGNLVYNIGKEIFGVVEARTSREMWKWSHQMWR